jgi:GntR family transcriptional repressor for pyruvate dehydrogenase complex
MTNMKSTHKIKPSQLTSQVIEHLQDAIAGGEYAIGVKLPAEPLLMAELGVGRSTIREAIRVLAHNGILEVRQGDGTYVRALPAHGEPLAQKLGRAKASEVNEVRRSLELEIVRLAALRRGDADLERMRGFLRQRHDALANNDPAGVLDSDISFHCAVADAAGNEVLADIYRTFAYALREVLASLWEVDGKASETAGLHDKLVAAIEARDASLAVAAATAMLDSHATTLSSMEKK